MNSLTLKYRLPRPKAWETLICLVDFNRLIHDLDRCNSGTLLQLMSSDGYQSFRHTFGGPPSTEAISRAIGNLMRTAWIDRYDLTAQ